AHSVEANTPQIHGEVIPLNSLLFYLMPESCLIVSPKLILYYPTQKREAFITRFWCGENLSHIFI
ncbi:MAG: hypothetical protein ACYT04_82805, partial [Nostoc sp.]